MSCCGHKLNNTNSRKIIIVPEKWAVMYIMKSLNSDGQQFDQYKQNEQSPLTANH